MATKKKASKKAGKKKATKKVGKAGANVIRSPQKS